MDTSMTVCEIRRRVYIQNNKKEPLMKITKAEDIFPSLKRELCHA